MDTNERLRKRALRYITIGVNQKMLAAKMGMPPSTFSKWLNGKLGSAITVDAADGLRAFEREMANLIAADNDEITGETQRGATTNATTAEGNFPEKRQINQGPPPGVPERRQKTG